MATERVTITLPEEIVRSIDTQERNRSRFILQAVQGELERRRRAALRRSLEHPHPEAAALADEELAEWMERASEDDHDLLDPAGGRDVRWVPDRGWIEANE